MLLRRLFSALGLLVLVGCGSSPEPTDPAALTWHRDIQPIVDRACVRCHTEGGIAPGTFDDFATVRDYAASIADQLSSGAMPPPASDPECRPYLDSHQLYLEPAERQQLIEWVADGTPEGDPADAPEPVDYGRTLEGADLTLTLPTAYQPDFSDGNEYRCFAIDNPLDERVWLTGLEALIDNTPIVHHIVLFRDTSGTAGGATPTDQGWDCIDTVVERDWEFLHGWAPGNGPFEAPEGWGMPLEPDDRIVLQMHYFEKEADLGPDQSGYRFRTTTEPQQTLFMFPFGTTSFTIPAGAESHSVDSTITFDDRLPSLSLLGTFPHMHVLGSGYRMWIERADGTEECLVQGDYDFDNQYTYVFQEPARISEGDTVHFECTWDNSSTNPDQMHQPPIDIYYGERTDEEMCFAFSYGGIAL